LHFLLLTSKPVIEPNHTFAWSLSLQDRAQLSATRVIAANCINTAGNAQKTSAAVAKQPAELRAYQHELSARVTAGETQSATLLALSVDMSLMQTKLPQIVEASCSKDKAEVLHAVEELARVQARGFSLLTEHVDAKLTQFMTQMNTDEESNHKSSVAESNESINELKAYLKQFIEPLLMRQQQ
jgi:hypothetical protein